METIWGVIEPFLGQFVMASLARHKFSQDTCNLKLETSYPLVTQKTGTIHQAIELSFSVVTVPDKAQESLPGRQEEKGESP